MHVRTIPRFTLVAALAACSASEPGPSEVFDTSGARFAWVCSEHCSPEATEGTPPLPPCNIGTPLYAWAIDRFINIDAGCAFPDGGWGSTANRSRPLACDNTFDCPQFTTGSFECRAGLCQSSDTVNFPPTVVTWSMAYALCYAAIARSETIDPLSDASVNVSMWVKEACPAIGEPCSMPLPSMCMQP